MKDFKLNKKDVIKYIINGLGCSLVILSDIFIFGDYIKVLYYIEQYPPEGDYGIAYSYLYFQSIETTINLTIFCMVLFTIVFLIFFLTKIKNTIINIILPIIGFISISPFYLFELWYICIIATQQPSAFKEYWSFYSYYVIRIFINIILYCLVFIEWGFIIRHSRKSS